MTGDSDVNPADTMAERTGGSRVALHLLLQTNRLLLAGGLTAVVFVAAVAGLSTLEPPLAQRAATSDPIETLFAAMITAIVTVATFVVTIGQLVLSQENGPLGDQRDRMENSMGVRDDVRSVTGSPAPTEPAALLGVLLDATITQARTLGTSVQGSPATAEGDVHAESVGRSTEETFHADVASVAEDVVENADEVRDRLDGADFGTFAVVGAALTFNYDGKIVAIEGLQSEFGDRLTGHQRETLSELKGTLSLYAAAREHVKTLYFQWSLIDLSRLILFAAIPALVVAAIMIGVVTPETAPGRTLGIDHLVLLVSGAFAVTFLPFAIFASYVLRVLTVTKRTLAIDPLVLRSSK